MIRFRFKKLKVDRTVTDGGHILNIGMGSGYCSEVELEFQNYGLDVNDRMINKSAWMRVPIIEPATPDNVRDEPILTGMQTDDERGPGGVCDADLKTEYVDLGRRLVNKETGQTVMDTMNFGTTTIQGCGAMKFSIAMEGENVKLVVDRSTLDALLRELYKKEANPFTHLAPQPLEMDPTEDAGKLTGEMKDGDLSTLMEDATEPDLDGLMLGDPDPDYFDPFGEDRD